MRGHTRIFLSSVKYTMPMKFSLAVKALSINAAYRGRRFKTDDLESYEYEIGILTARLKVCPIEGEMSVRYIFHLKNYSRTDVANLEKCLTDILVKLEIIKDDRYIKDMYVRKEMSDRDYIEIEIDGYKKIPSVVKSRSGDL